MGIVEVGDPVQNALLIPSDGANCWKLLVSGHGPALLPREWSDERSTGRLSKKLHWKQSVKAVPGGHTTGGGEPAALPASPGSQSQSEQAC